MFAQREIIIFENKKKHKYETTSGSRANGKLTHFAANNQYLTKLLKIFELKVHLTNEVVIYNNYNTIVILFK